ncbi:hypothetical protein [Aeropyrum camini]|nr:hypothetical protein [Aeropyrum camini]
MGEEYSPEDYRFPELYIEDRTSERSIWVDVERRSTTGGLSRG